MLKDFLSIKETADYLGISVSTVRRMLADGRLRGSNLGRIWRIPREAVEELVAAGMTQKPQTVDPFYKSLLEDIQNSKGEAANIDLDAAAKEITKNWR